MPKAFKKMNFQVQRALLHVLWFIAFILLLVIGIVCLFLGDGVIDATALRLGLGVFVSGAAQFGIALLMRHTPFGLNRFSDKGIMMAIAGIVFMLRQFFAAEALRSIVSMVVLLDGLMLLGCAWDLRKDVRHSQWLWLIGAVESVIGVAGLLNPVMHGLLHGTAIGIQLIVESIAIAFSWFLCVSWYTAAKRPESKEPRPAPNPAPAPAPAPDPVQPAGPAPEEKSAGAPEAPWMK